MTAVTVNPRLDARRVAVQRDVTRRRTRRLMIVLSLLSTVLLAWLVVNSPLLDVDDVQIRGLDRVSLDAAEEAMGVSVGDSMARLDTGAIAEKLESMAWVDEVAVTRRWPGTLEITVTEREAVAVTLVDADQWVLVDSDGRVLSEALGLVPSLPRLTGLRAAAEPGTFLAGDAAAPLAIITALPDSVAEQVAAIWRDGDGELSMSLISGDVVVLGGDLDLRAKVAAAATMVELMAEQGRVDWIIDVSVPSLTTVSDR
jgi:cell division protein FtsQ